jgi:hypothetical protein
MDWKRHATRRPALMRGLTLIGLVVALGCGLGVSFLPAQDSTDPPLYRVLRGGKWGYIDAAGTVQVAIEYDYAFPYRNGYTVVRRGDFANGSRAYLDASGNRITEFLFDRAYHFVNGYGTAIIDGKWGFVSPDGRSIGGFAWDAVRDFRDGYGTVRIGGYRDGVWGLIDTNGFTALPVEYEGISFLGEGLWAARKGGLWGFFRPEEGKPERFLYERIRSTDDGPIIVKRSGDYAIVDRDEEVLFTSDDEIDGLSEGVATIDTGDATIYRDIATNGVVGDPRGYDRGYSFAEGVAIVGIGSDWRSRTWGLLGRDGALVVQPIYSRIFTADDTGLLRVERDGRYGYISSEGAVVVEPVWERVGSFAHGRCAVMRDGVWGYVDTAGDVVIPLKYDYAWDFVDGMAVVREGSEESGIRRYIDTNGGQAVPGEYRWAYAFEGPLAHVADGAFVDGVFGYIDTTGTVVWELQN